MVSYSPSIATDALSLAVYEIFSVKNGATLNSGLAVEIVTLPSQTKSLHFLNPATITFVNFAVTAHVL